MGSPKRGGGPSYINRTSSGSPKPGADTTAWFMLHGHPHSGRET